jgi:hypothetical protein
MSNTNIRFFSLARIEGQVLLAGYQCGMSSKFQDSALKFVSKIISSPKLMEVVEQNPRMSVNLQVRKSSNANQNPSEIFKFHFSLRISWFPI